MIPADDIVFRRARDAMIADQLMARGISSARVLHAMAAVPREQFVPPEERAHAYEDCALPVGEGQTISQPYMVAVMTQLLDVHHHHRVLEIGTGTGYQAAVLAQLAREVFTIERIRTLSEAASQRLSALGIANVHFHVGDGSMGWPGACVAQDGRFPANAPPAVEFDRIVVTAGAPEIPPPLLAQLADGGILVAPRGDSSSQRIVVITRAGATFSEKRELLCRFVPLIGAHGWREGDPRA